MSHKEQGTSPERIELTKATNGRPWKSPEDIRLAETTVFPPGQTTYAVVALTRANLPNLENIREGHISELLISMRSGHAQMGLEAVRNATLIIEDSIHPEDFPVFNGKDSQKTVLARVPIDNHSRRPLLVRKNGNLFRFYTDFTGRTIKGSELETLVASTDSGSFSVTGSRGIEYLIKYNGKGEATGVLIQINEPRWWLPPDTTPLDITDFHGTDRNSIDQHLVTAPVTDEPILTIGETVVVNFGYNNAILKQRVFGRNEESFRPDQPAIELKEIRQIRSTYFDPNKNYGIRVELVGPTTQRDGNLYSFLQIAGNRL